MIILQIVGAVLVGLAGLKKRGAFGRAFLIGLVTTPIIGFIIVNYSAPKYVKGCNHCGNKLNEAEYCGICKKNEAGDLRPEGKLK